MLSESTHQLSVFTEDHAGVLTRLLGLQLEGARVPMPQPRLLVPGIVRHPADPATDVLD